MAAKKTTKGRGKSPAKTTRKKKAQPRKKTSSKAKAGKSSGKLSLVHELKKAGLGIAILLAICLTTAMLADIFLKSGRPVPHQETKSLAQKDTAPGEKPLPDPPRTKAKADGLKKKPGPGPERSPEPGSSSGKPAIVYEVFDQVAPDLDKTIPVPPKDSDHTPQIAIIIDDIGYDRRLARALFDLDKDITFSILPFSPFGKSLAKSLSAKGAELMLHLPMEPTQYPRVNPGPGALLSSMPPDVLLDQLRKNLKDVPGVKGVNNHMGSRLTADSDKLNQIFTVLKKKDLFFIDSRTASGSQGQASARLFLLKFSQRDVFLDNEQNVGYISGQFRKLVKRAEKHGTAIGIGHPYQATLDALKIELPKLNGRVRVVRASRLVAIPG
jgi:polysaccharide deacetylase 2 family uncharacterized protein YibQ